MNGEGRTLLIVDDDTAFRERIVRAMRDRGYEATGAPDHPSALNAASDESPELALVDLRLPGESGLTVVRELKAAFDGAQPTEGTEIPSLAPNGNTFNGFLLLRRQYLPGRAGSGRSSAFAAAQTG